MSRINPWKAPLLAMVLSACVLIPASTASADDPILVEMYGRGVHAFNRGDYYTALQLLDSVASQGSGDPRVHYFLGLTKLRMGDEPAAQASFTRGAELEMDVSQVYPIGKALERIQGPDRLMLEGYRDKVRIQAYMQRQKRDQSRYEQLRSAEEEVLRDPDAPAAPAPAMDVPADETDPFGSPGAGATTPPPVTPVPAPAVPAPPAAVPAVDNTDPFGTPSTPVPAPMTDDSDPFGTPAAPPMTTPEPADTDPFGTPMVDTEPTPIPPAVDDPFAQPDAAMSTPGSVPQTTPVPSDESDPFGATTPDIDPFAPASPDMSEPFPSAVPPVEDPLNDAVPMAEPMPAGTGSTTDSGSGKSGNPLSAAFGALSDALIPSVRVPAIPGMPGGEQSSMDSDGMDFGDDTEFAPGTDPFGADDSMPLDDAASDPFGSPDTSDPFGATDTDDPFGAADSADPAMNDPFGASEEDAAPPASSDPFGAPEEDAAPPASNDPFGAAADDPFGSPTDPAMEDPFGN